MRTGKNWNDSHWMVAFPCQLFPSCHENGGAIQVRLMEIHALGSSFQQNGPQDWTGIVSVVSSRTLKNRDKGEDILPAHQGSLKHNYQLEMEKWKAPAYYVGI